MHYFTKPQLTLNQRVWGSSPQGITIEINKCESTFFFHKERCLIKVPCSFF